MSYKVKWSYSTSHLFQGFIQLFIETRSPVNLNTKISELFLCCEIFVFVKNRSEIRIIACEKRLIRLCLYSKLVCSSLHILLFFFKFPWLFHASYFSVHNRQFLCHLQIKLPHPLCFYWMGNCLLIKEKWVVLKQLIVAHRDSQFYNQRTCH